MQDNNVYVMKIKSTILVLLFLSFVLLNLSLVHVGFSSVMWSKTYGGSGTQTVDSIIETSDGGYAILGITGPFDRHPDLLLIKTDANGAMQWNKTYGTVNSNGKENIDMPKSIVQTNDGGYAIAGYTEVYASGNSETLLIKTDKQGNVEWNYTYPGPQYDHPNSLILTSDDGFALFGTIAGRLDDYYVVKTDSQGNYMWSKIYGTADRDFGESIVETSDGGYALAGYIWSYTNGTSAYQLLKIDSMGNMEWNQTYGWNQTFGRYSLYKVNDLVKTSDGGYALGGTARNPISLDSEFLLVKTDEFGNLKWNYTYWTADSDDNALIQTSDGGFAFASSSHFGDTRLDIWLIKTDENGNVELNQTYPLENNQEVSSLLETSDGGYVLAGQTFTEEGEGDFWLIKTDAYGIPEFSSWIILPLLAVAPLFVIVIKRKLFQSSKDCK
jgi:hypothetical protein